VSKMKGEGINQSLVPLCRKSNFRYTHNLSQAKNFLYSAYLSITMLEKNKLEKDELFHNMYHYDHSLS